MGKKYLLLGDMRGCQTPDKDEKHQTLDHLDFPPAVERDREWIVSYYESGFTMREICYIFHCNLYSIYVAIHPDHPKRLQEYRNQRRGMQVGSCCDIVRRNPDMTDEELIRLFGFNPQQIETARRKARKK